MKTTKIPKDKLVSDILQEHEDRLYILETGTQPVGIISKLAVRILAAIVLIAALKKITDH